MPELVLERKEELVVARQEAEQQRPAMVPVPELLEPQTQIVFEDGLPPFA
jgi:hypothetical protein